MALQVIPTRDAPFYSQTTDLDGTPYVLSFSYDQRHDRWLLAIASATDGTSVISGLRLVPGADLFEPYRHALNMPPGGLFVVPLGPDDSPPGLADLAPEGRCALVYFAVTE